jgi:hypothetical protein
MTRADGKAVTPGPFKTAKWSGMPQLRAVRLNGTAKYESLVTMNGGRIGDIDYGHGAEIAKRCNAHERLVEALTTLLERHTSLVNCGDCGNWNPETEDEVIAARAALQIAEAG